MHQRVFSLCVLVGVLAVANGARAQTTLPSFPSYPPSPTLPPPASVEQQGQGTSRALFFAAVIQPLLQAGGSALASGVGDLIRQFFSATVAHQQSGASTTAMGASPGSAPMVTNRPNVPMASYPNYQPPPGTAPTGFVQPPMTGVAAPVAAQPMNFTWTDSQPKPAAAGASLPTGPLSRGLTPSLVLTVDRLDPASFSPIGQLSMGTGELPRLRTGEVFAVRFATNLPGLLSIENTDSAGVHTVLGTYTVLPGADNRYPRRKGLALAGATGPEVYEVYFLPCIPNDERGQPLVAGIADRLTACPPPAAAAQLSVPTQSRAIRSTINLDSPDPALAAVVAPVFSPSDVTKSRFVIQHDP